MTEEKSHNDIYRRVEKVEIEVAVLNASTTRLHTDLVELKQDVKETSRIARRISWSIYIIPIMLGALYTLLQIVKVAQ